MSGAYCLSNTLNLFQACVNAFQNGNAESCSFPGAVFGPSKDVSASQRNRDALLLNRGWLLEAFFVYPLQEFALQEVVLKVVPFGCGYILQTNGAMTIRVRTPWLCCSI